MSAKMSQKEYLKKYLSGGSDKKKKKKDKKSKINSATVKIIDDDVHGGNNPEIDEELLLTGEDAPQIVGIIDATGNNGAENKWKSISGSVKEEITETQKPDDDLWGKKATSYSAADNHMERKRKCEQSPQKYSKVYREPRRSDDHSPPRRQRNTDQSSTRPHIQGEVRKNSDHSPPRRRDVIKARRGSDSSPPRRSPVRQRKNSDQSPPRRRDAHKSRRDSDSSPPIRSPARQRKNSDQSPPRRRDAPKSRRDSDLSPPRRSPVRKKENPDHSPPRKTRWDSSQRKGADADQSPPRKRSPGRPSQQPNTREDFNDDSGRIKREKSADQSPPRRGNGNPFRSNTMAEKPSPDNSPQRHRPRRSSDQSPPRIKRERHSESPPPTHKNSGKMSKTLDGKRAGLQDAKTLKAETEERRRAEDRMFNKMSSEVSGRDAEVQVRQSSAYRRRRKEKEEDPEVQRKKAEHEQQKKELYSRWNKGLKQIETYQAKITEEQYESSKPLARYSDDVDLDEMLKKQEREDDPMLEYIRNKKQTQLKEANVPIMPKYKGSFPENRFDIPPGYRWDGVDRSNGYENKWFNVQSQKKAQAEEAYKYSTEDM